MDLSSLSPDVLASLAQALQQGTSPTELLSQIVQQQHAPLSTPNTATEAVPVPTEPTKAVAAPPTPISIVTPPPAPQPVPPPPLAFRPSSRQALDDRLNQKMLQYKSMAQQRAALTQNQSTPQQTGQFLGQQGQLQARSNSFKGAPLSREEVERRNKELKAFKEAVKHHRNAGRKVPDLNDETLFNMIEKNLKRPLTAPPIPTTLAKMQQMALAKQNKKRIIAPPKLVVPKDDPQPETKVQGQKGVVPLNVPAHLLRLKRTNTSISRTLNPKATARERMNALREQKQKQEEVLTGPKAAQASISAAHQQLRQRAEALRQLLASQK